MPWTRSGWGNTRREFRPKINVDEYASLKEILERSCGEFAELPAYGNMGVSITYRELDRASREFGAYLQKVIGLKKGDRVAIMLPNLLQYPVALFGVLRAGMTVVNVNPMYTARELEHQLNDSGATAIVVLENFAHTLQEVLAKTPIKTVITTQIGDLFPQPKGLLTNCRREAREEDGAALAHCERDRVQGRLAGRASANARRRAAQP